MAVVRTDRLTRHNVSFGPFRFTGAMPWLLMAIAFRVLAGDDQPVLGLLTWFAANLAVLMAFLAMTRSVLHNHHDALDGLSMADELRLALRLCLRMSALIAVAVIVADDLGDPRLSHDLMWGLDINALHHFTVIGRVTDAGFATLTLLLVLGTDPATRKPNFVAAFRGAARHGPRFALAAATLVPIYVIVGVLQQALFTACLHGPLSAVMGSYARNLAGVAVLFAFGTFRLWLTVAVLGRGLARSEPSIALRLNMRPPPSRANGASTLS